MKLARKWILDAMILFATGCTTGDYERTSFPGDRWIGDMEEYRIDGPGDPTRNPGRSVIEFGSNVEIRNVRCIWKTPGREATCDFERRVTPFAAQPGEWEHKSRTFTIEPNGRWSAQIEFENAV